MHRVPPCFWPEPPGCRNGDHCGRDRRERCAVRLEREVLSRHNDMKPFHRVPQMDRADRIGRRMKLRDLQLLDAVARWGSIAKAAGQLNLTQSAASKAITQLEHALGARLLDRTSRGVEPTRY